MEVKHGHLLLFFVYFIRQVTARHTDQISDILEYLNLPRNQSPLIVVLTPGSQTQNVESGQYDVNTTGEDGRSDDTSFDEDAPEEVAKSLLYDYLSLRTGDPKNTEEEREDDKKNALRAALRARCQSRVQCEKKCDRNESKDKYCPVNCKAVFDNLNLCEAPKEKKSCQKEDTCGKRGRTMPPKWL